MTMHADRKMNDDIQHAKVDKDLDMVACISLPGRYVHAKAKTVQNCSHQE
jgi:hypothetical protein